MKLANNQKPTLALCVHNDAIRVLTVEMIDPKYNIISISENGRVIDNQLEYEDRFDVYYSPSDDGNTWYNSVHVVSFDPSSQIQLPNPADVTTYKQHIMPLAIEAVSNDQMDSDDLGFVVRILKTPAFFYNAWASAGNKVSGVEKLMKSIFQYYIPNL